MDIDDGTQASVRLGRWLQLLLDQQYAFKDDAFTGPSKMRKEAVFNLVVLGTVRHVTEGADSGNVPVLHPRQVD